MQNVSMKGWSGFSSMFNDGSKNLDTNTPGPQEDTSLLNTGTAPRSGKIHYEMLGNHGKE